MGERRWELIDEALAMSGGDDGGGRVRTARGGSKMGRRGWDGSRRLMMATEPGWIDG